MTHKMYPAGAVRPRGKHENISSVSEINSENYIFLDRIFGIYYF